MNSAVIALLCVFVFIICIFELVSVWITYKKVGIPGWKSLIPIYNYIVLFQIANVPMWMVLLLFIPFVNIYPLYLIYASLAEHLGKGRKYGMLMVFFPYVIYPIFAFSKSKVESVYMNVEEPIGSGQVLMDGPIEPLDARPDLEVEEPVVEDVVAVNPYEPVDPMVLHPGISNIQAPNLEEPSFEPLAPVVEISIEDPLTAQQKGQHVEEEKEVLPDVDIYKTCPNCGNKLEPSATACFLCGKRFEE